MQSKPTSLSHKQKERRTLTLGNVHKKHARSTALSQTDSHLSIYFNPLFFLFFFFFIRLAFVLHNKLSRILLS